MNTIERVYKNLSHKLGKNIQPVIHTIYYQNE